MYRSLSSDAQVIALELYMPKMHFLAAAKSCSNVLNCPNVFKAVGSTVTCFTSLVYAVRFPILKKLLIKSQPVIACAAGRLSHTLFPMVAAIVDTGMNRCLFMNCVECPACMNMDSPNIPLLT